MKYTVVKRIHFRHANDCVSVIKEAESYEEAMKFKVASEMLESEDSDNSIQILINTCLNVSQLCYAFYIRYLLL